MRQGMTRDSQRAKVYAWEQVAFSRNSTIQSPSNARIIIDRVLFDARQGGADFVCQPGRYDLRFDLNNGKITGQGAYSYFNFDPRALTHHLILHEVAHSLTRNPYTRKQTHIFDGAGHGENFTACLIVLREKYCGDSPLYAMKMANKFEMYKVKEKLVFSGRYSGSGNPLYFSKHVAETKETSVKVSMEAFRFWRKIFFK